MELQVLISKYSTIFISNFAPFCLHVIKMYHFKNYLYCARKSIFNWLNFSCNKCIVYVGKQKKMWVQDKKMRFLDFNNCIKFLQKRGFLRIVHPHCCTLWYIFNWHPSMNLFWKFHRNVWLVLMKLYNC